jgi:hypothetical protein
VRRLALAGLVTLLSACDDFSRFGSYDSGFGANDSGQCVATSVGVCSPNNPVFVQDLWFADAGEVPSAVWVGTNGGVWVGTETQSIYRSVPCGWALEYQGGVVASGTSGVNAFFGVGETPQFAGGYQGLSLSRSSGGNWTSTLLLPGSGAIFAFTGTSATDVWAAGDQSVSHLDDGGWGSQTLLFAGTWQGVWASSTLVLVAGYSSDGGSNVPAIVQVNGDGGLLEGGEGAFSGEFESIWGTGDNSIWAVGANETTSPSTAYGCYGGLSGWGCGPLLTGGGNNGIHAYGLWGRSSGDVWATMDGLVLHNSSNTQNNWTPVFNSAFLAKDGSPANLYRIAGNATQVWAAGQTLVHCP